jgi:hypothetical protein
MLKTFFVQIRPNVILAQAFKQNVDNFFKKCINVYIFAPVHSSFEERKSENASLDALRFLFFNVFHRAFFHTFSLSYLF